MFGKMMFCVFEGEEREREESPSTFSSISEIVKILRTNAVFYLVRSIESLPRGCRFNTSFIFRFAATFMIVFTAEPRMSISVDNNVV